MWIALVPPAVFAGMVCTLVHLCTCCTSDPTTIVLGPPAAKSPRPLPRFLLCLFVLVFMRVLCLVRFRCCFWCPCLLVLFGCFCSLLSLCSFGALPSLCVCSCLLYLDVLLRTDCQVTILDLQVYCDVLLPCTACHSLRIASQASTRTKAAVQVQRLSAIQVSAGP